MAQERTGHTFRGNPITLIGPELKVGEQAPNAIVSMNLTDEISLSQYSGKIRLISVTPSLDTGICDAQVRRFNEEAAKLGDRVMIINISMDLPPAQARWCGAAGIDKVVVLSDHKKADFGLNYGVLIEELRLDMRSVFVLDTNNTIQYIEILKEMREHPDYDQAIAAVKKLL